MDTKQILEALSALQEKSPQRKFVQSVDVSVKLRDLDLKKVEQKVDTFVTFPHPLGKAVKICALVDSQLAAQAKSLFSYVVTKEEFPVWKTDVKKQKRLANTCSFFIAQVEVMPLIAATFGKALGPRGKMPNPKAGCVVPGAIPDLKPLKAKLEKTIKLQTKNELAVKFSIGRQDLPQEHLVENLVTAYQALVKALPSGENNVKSIVLKYSMGPSYVLGKGFVHAVEGDSHG